MSKNIKVAQALVRLAKELVAKPADKKKKELHPDSAKFLVLVQSGKATQEDLDEFHKKHPEGISFVEK